MLREERKQLTSIDLSRHSTDTRPQAPTQPIENQAGTPGNLTVSTESHLNASDPDVDTSFHAEDLADACAFPLDKLAT